MSAQLSSVEAPLSAQAAEAIAVAAALHHLRAASAAGGPSREPVVETGWSREALLAGVDRGPHRLPDTQPGALWS